MISTTGARQTVSGVACPWCLDIIPITINVGFTNRHAPGGKRQTSVAVRRTAAVTHQCIDPTVGQL